MPDPTPTTPILEEDAPTPQAPPRGSLVLPAHIFVTDLIAAPEGLEMEDYDALVELEIEQASPFPVEQLIWGWLLINKGKTILSFATTIEKARASGASNLSDPDTAILAPFTLCDYSAETSKNVLFYGAHQDVIAVAYDSEGELVEVETLLLEANDSRYDAERQAKHALDFSENSEFTHLHLGEPERNDDTGLTWPAFTSPDPSEDEDPDHITTIASADAWYVDLRDRDFKNERQGQLKQSNRIWTALSVMLFCAILMLCFEVLQWSVRGYLDFQDLTLTQQAPVKDRLEQQQDFLHKMSDIEQSQMRPFAVLAVLNENRPENIHFFSAEAINSTEYEIKAQGLAVTEVNNYVATYAGNPAFADISHKVTSSRNGRVLFDLSLKVGELPEIIELSPETNEPSSEE